MRYFLIIFGVCVLAVAGVLGKRGSHFRKPSLYIFPDMERQLKLRPHEQDADCQHQHYAQLDEGA